MEIFSYKCGWITIPVDNTWHKNRSKWKRGFYRQKSFERWKYRKRYYHRHSPTLARSIGCEASLNGTTHPAAFTTVLNIDKRTNERSSIVFDSDSSSVVCDNSANVHICNSRQSFIGELKSVTGHKVATIGGRGHAASGTGTVKWRWKDDTGNTHEYLDHNTLYFP